MCCQPETLKHYICYCKKFNSARTRLRRSTSKAAYSSQRLLGDAKLFRHVLQTQLQWHALAWMYPLLATEQFKQYVLVDLSQFRDPKPRTCSKSVDVETEIPLEVDPGLLMVTDLNPLDEDAYE